MNFPSPNHSDQNPTKQEPTDILVIDEDAFEKMDRTLQPPEMLRPPEIAQVPNLRPADHLLQVSALADQLTFTRKNRDPLSGDMNRCVVCNRNYSSPSNLRAHVLNVHMDTSKTDWYQCSVCGKKCKTKHYLINHEMQKHGIRQKSKYRMPYLDMSSDDTV